MGQNPSFKCFFAAGADETIHFFAVFLDNVGRNAQNAVLLGFFLVLVHVNLFKFHFSLEFFFQLLDDGIHRSARKTPDGPEINQFDHNQTIIARASTRTPASTVKPARPLCYHCPCERFIYRFKSRTNRSGEAFGWPGAGRGRAGFGQDARLNPPRRLLN